MPLIIHTSGLRLGRIAAPVREQAPVVQWPIRRGGKIVMVPIPPQRIPAGWQAVHARIPQRLASCAEVQCPMFLNGWTEVGLGNGPYPIAGRLTSDEARLRFGTVNGDNSPVTIEHPPGTPCPRVHKTASGAPPVYRVNGLVMEETAFLDAIGEGVYAQQRRTQEGSY